MKKWVPVLAVLLCLTGCGGENKASERGLRLRSQVLQAETVRFHATVTADYGDKVYDFAMDCQGDGQGDLTFTVTAPETIAGITGTLSGEGGTLTFDDTALAFPLLAEGLPSPVSAPWLLLKALRSGPIVSAGMEDEKLRLSINCGYEDTAFSLDIWCDGENTPVTAEIAQDGRTILSLSLENVTLLSQNGESSHNLG